VNRQITAQARALNDSTSNDASKTPNKILNDSTSNDASKIPNKIMISELKQAFERISTNTVGDASGFK